MDKHASYETLHKPIPEEILGNVAHIPDQKQYIKQMLYDDLPASDRFRVEKELKWNFVLDKHSLKKNKVQEYRKRVLTRKDRERMNIMQLSKTGWKHKKLEPMRELWKNYMRDNLGTVSKPKCSDPEWSSYSIVLSKSELIGSEIEIVRSKVPSTVGVKGTVVLETKSSFQIVTPKNELKILLKQPSVFQIILDSTKFTFFGKHLITRPVERSVKKIKSFMLLDL